MSYQSEERYWSDYLRIALPIAGLLLLLGVFWYWANSFIGDDGDNPPATVQVAVATTPITAELPTATTTTAMLITPQTVDPTAPAVIINTPASGDVNATVTTGSTNSGGFAEGEIVIVNDNDVNMRAEATTESDIIDTLALGTELRVLSAQSTESDDRTWWNVEDTTNNITGWVAEEFIDTVEG